MLNVCKTVFYRMGRELLKPGGLAHPLLYVGYRRAMQILLERNSALTILRQGAMEYQRNGKEKVSTNGHKHF
jgi:hypothetical protein